MSRAVVVGLDGAAWHLLYPLLDQGLMPRLERLLERSARGTLLSTIPTYTPPAWTSAITGVNPGRHGVYGFVAGHAQHQPARLMHSGMVKSETLWEMAARSGARAGIYNVPLTYPPQQISGWMVSGMLTPGYGEKTSGFATWDRSPDNDSLEAKILEWAPGYVLDLHANYEQDWRDDALCDRALASIRQRNSVLQGLLDLDPPDVVFTVLETPDRLQHVYYRYMDPDDEMWASPEAELLRPRIAECFSAIDEIVGILEDYADGGPVIVCSDHGFTSWRVTVHVNRLLEQWGYLRLRPQARALQTSLARAAVPVAKRFLPRKVARDAKAKTFAAIDWSRTRAFASPIPQQGIFLNLAGREPFGIVPADEAETLKDEIKRAFLNLEARDGRPATDRVHLAREVFWGEELEGAPDILPVLRDHTFELDDELFHKDPFSDVAHLPRGVHHPHGIVAVAGEGTAVGEALQASVLDVTPTLLYMAGLPVPEGLDGRVIQEAFHPDHLSDNPVRTTTAAAGGGRAPEDSPYSAEEEALIEESLRGLGYL